MKGDRRGSNPRPSGPQPRQACCVGLTVPRYTTGRERPIGEARELGAFAPGTEVDALQEIPVQQSSMWRLH